MINHTLCTEHSPIWSHAFNFPFVITCVDFNALTMPEWVTTKVL